MAPEGVFVLDFESELKSGDPGDVLSVSPDAFAYILYTSGTTGAPKGTVQSHENVLHHVRAYSEALRIGPGDRLTLLSSYSFDASVMAIFGALLNGAALFPFAVAEEGIDRLPPWVREKRITLYHSTPTVYRYFVAALGRSEHRFSDLRAIVLGGEEVTRRDVGLYRERFTPGAVLVNGFGPTESTLAVQYFIDGESEIPGERVPVGFPVEDTEIWLLDEAGERTELHGEIGIRSRHVAVGYWGNPELTRERFLPDPEGGGRRIYRTGDLGRFLPGGELEFLGRKDFQIKVRGMRVETGAVEAFLAAHPAVEECAVTGREAASGETFLAAYVVPREGETVTPAALRSFLEERLPSHMVPSSTVLLESIPLTATGKIDRKRLPEAALKGTASRSFEGPRTVTEEMLCGIWSDVLGVDKVSVHNDFFELGGHSLRATQVGARIRESFGLALPLRALFEATTVAELASRIEASSGQDHGHETMALLPRDRDLPLSFSQERLWFFDQMEPESATYNIAGAIRLEGTLDLEALERSLVEIVRRHETLRSSFRSIDGRPAVRVEPEDGFVLTVVSLRGDERELSSWLKAEAARPFDLSRGSLLRCSLLRLSENDQVLALATHHIVCDGWSLGILLRELSALYRTFTGGSEGEAPPLPAPTLQYADFAAWQRSWLRGETLSSQLGFWKNEIGGEVPALELPTDRPRPPVLTYRGAREPFRLPSDLASGLRRLSRSEDATLFMTLLAAFNVLLSRHTGQDDILVGTPIAGRSRVEVEPLIGCFVNTLALRTDLAGDPAFRELLARVRRKTLDAFGHQDLPFEKLVQELQPDRDLARNPLFQVVFALQNAPLSRLVLPGLTVRGVEVPSERAHFDLTFTLVESGGEIFGALEYNTDLFEASTIRRLLSRFERLLEGVVRNAGARLSELPLLSAEEVAGLEAIEGKGVSTAGYDMVRWFEHTARAGASRLAVSQGSESLTYRGLSARANGVALAIADRGAGPGSIVGVLLPRSFDLIVSLVGAAKSGAAVLPLDGSYPPERLSFLLEDSGAALVLTGREIWSRHQALHGAGVPVFPIFVDELDAAPEGPKVDVDPESLLYVSYTSGSTGLPKGVEVSHRAVARLVKDQTYVSLTEESRILQLAPLSFDASTFEIWGALANGGCVVLYPERVPTAEELRDELRERGVTTLWLTGALFNAMVDESPSCVASVKEVVVGGEALSVAHVKRAQQSSPETTFINGYGPTEGTTFTCCHRIPRGIPEGSRSIPIGRVLRGSRVYVLDAHGKRVPEGVAGELFIGGAGLARGYRGRPDLTAERFLPDPFSREAGARMYRTSDRVRVLKDGSIDYLGRLDQQVKLRGYRIEPGEIEHVLTRHESVREAAVVVSEDERGERRLVGYVVFSTEGASTPAALRDYLSARLPEYMVPQAILVLPALPRTGNGKLDRKALPRPEWGSASGPLSVVAPRGPVEESLADIWMELLGVEHAGVHDNFFHLGGHSLLAAQLMSRVRKAFQVELPLRSLFLSPTIGALARQIEERLEGGGSETALPLEPLQKIPREGELSLSFSQQRLWFLFQLEPNNTAYNIATGGKLEGPLDVEALSRSVDVIVRRHESLRTTFGNLEGRPLVRIHPPDRDAALPLTEIDLSSLEPRDRAFHARRIASAEAERPFDLGTGPLFRALVLRSSPREHALLLTMHHIVSDGWSMGLLFQELSALYRGFATGESAVLPDLSIQYVDYAEWQRRALEGAVLRRELDYWRERLRGLTRLDLPTDRPRPAVQSFRGGRRRAVLGSDLTASLRELARREGVTTFMAFLALFQALLRKYSGQDDVVVGTPIANRNREEIEGLIGFFVNNLVLRTDLSGEPTFRELLVRVREVALGAYAHHLLPFEKMVEELSPDRDMSRNPLFQVTYVHEVYRSTPYAFHDLELSGIDLDLDRAHFDLSLFTYESASTFGAFFEYNRDLFDESTIDRMLRHFRSLAEEAAARPDEPISVLSVLSEAERQKLLVDWARAPEAEDSEDETIDTLVAAAARRFPERVALDFQDGRVTYGDLALRSNRLAHYLRRLGVSRETPVSVLLSRSAQSVVALLAVLKSGGFYVPLDASYPDERLDFLMRDSGGSLLLTEEKLRHRIPSAATRVVFVDLDRERIDLEPESLPPAANDPESLAYVIYTSGSTGEPKGVAVSHRAIRRLVVRPNYIEVSKGDRVAQASNFSFDAATFEIWGALANGASLCGISKEVALAPEDFGRELRERGITVLFLTTALFQQIAREAPSTFGRLRVLLFGGEAVSPSAVGAVLGGEERPEHFLHVYGPTESTTFASWFPVTSSDEATTVPNIPIGGPLSGTELYVLDPDGTPAPVGVVGELFIGGAGLARGYLGRPALTAERFVPHPFGASPGARLYRTGDLVRRRGDGNIEFVGRNDHQVKIRGFRVEPSEIGAVLRGHENVREAVVVADTERHDEGAAKRLVAYVVARRRPAPTLASLRSYLSDRLPDFMMPQSFVMLEELPLTPNGKVDRRALPAPDRVRPELKAGFAPPRNDLERAVASLWQELLGLDAVGIHDSFFDLGGHSLLMAELHGKLRKRFGIEVAMVKLFQYPTIASLLEHLASAEGEEVKKASPLGKVQDRAERQKEALSRRTAARRSRSKA